MVVVVPHGAHDYRSRLGAASVCRPAAPGYPPPQVVLAAACAAERRAPPPAVRSRAPLDDRGASVGGQLLEDQPEPPVQVRPLPQRVRHARVQPYRLRQRARLVGLLRRDVRPEAVGLVGGSRPGPACAAVPASVGHYSSSSSCITLLASTHASVSRALRLRIAASSRCPASRSSSYRSAKRGPVATQQPGKPSKSRPSRWSRLASRSSSRTPCSPKRNVPPG